MVGSLPDGVNPSPFVNDWIVGIVPFGDSLYVATKVGAWVSQISTGLNDWRPFNTPFLSTVPWKHFVTDGSQIIGYTGTDAFTHVPGPGPWVMLADRTPGPIHRVTENRNDILASGENGLFRWNGNGWTLVNAALTSNDSFLDRFVYATASDETGRIAAANVDGLVTEPTGGAPPWPSYVHRMPPGNEIVNIGVHDSRVYVTTELEGVGRFDGVDWRIWPRQDCTVCDTTFLSPAYSYAFEVDRQGHKWFGMWGVAVEELNDTVDPPQVTHHTYGGNRLQTEIWASAVDSVHGGLWFGGDSHLLGEPGWDPLGLLYYNRLGADSLNLRQDSLSNIRGNKVHGLAVDRGQRVWVGFSGQGIQTFAWPTTPGGAFDFITVTGSENYNVQGLVARGDSVYAMTDREVLIYNRFNQANGAVGSFLLPSVPPLLDLHPFDVGLDGTIYAGTTAGLRVRRPDGAIVDYDAANSPIAGDEVRAVRLDPATGAIWIGTSQGLNRFDPGYVAPPPPPPPSALDFTIYPNPVATSGLGIALRINGNASSYRGVVLDLNGREVHRFEGTGNQGVVWDGRHQGGDRVRPGIYFVRVEVGGKSAIRRIAVVR